MLLVAGTLAVYSQAVGFSFINIDDPTYASQNPQVQAGLSLAGLRWSLGVHDCNWVPLTWLSLMLDSTLFGIGPAGYHATNVVLHAANALILFLALASATGYTARSAFVAALFALHPLHVESVAWVAERKDVLSIFFGLLSLWTYVRYTRVGKARWFVGIALALPLQPSLQADAGDAAVRLLAARLLAVASVRTKRLASPRRRRRVRRTANAGPAVARKRHAKRHRRGSVAQRFSGGWSKRSHFSRPRRRSRRSRSSLSRRAARLRLYPFSVRCQNAVCVYLTLSREGGLSR